MEHQTGGPGGFLDLSGTGSWVPAVKDTDDEASCISIKRSELKQVYGLRGIQKRTNSTTLTTKRPEAGFPNRRL